MRPKRRSSRSAGRAVWRCTRSRVKAREHGMYYAELTVAEPIEKLLGDWDLLEDRVVKKLTAFKELNDQVIGVRRRLFENNAVFDRVKGRLPEGLELTPKGIVTTKYEMLTLNMTVGGTPHRVPNSFGYWHINDADEMYLT